MIGLVPAPQISLGRMRVCEAGLAVALHTFTLILDRDAEPLLDRLHEAGCRDAVFRVQDGVPVAHFFREAPTLQRAIATAARGLGAAGLDVVGIATVASPTNDRR